MNAIKSRQADGATSQRCNIETVKEIKRNALSSTITRNSSTTLFIIELALQREDGASGGEEENV